MWRSSLHHSLFRECLCENGVILNQWNKNTIFLSVVNKCMLFSMWTKSTLLQGQFFSFWWWLFISVSVPPSFHGCSIHVQDPLHSANSAGGRFHLNTQACYVRMQLWMTWHCKLVHGFMVHTQLAPRRQQFHVAPATKQSCKYTTSVAK